MELAPWQGGPRRLLVAAYGTPIPQGSTRTVRARGAVRANTIHSNAETLEPWRQTVAYAARDALPGPPLTGPLDVELTFTMPRPRSVKRAWPSTRPDLDKLTRAVLDALTDAHVWLDDGQVVKLGAEETYGHDRALDRPGVLIVVTELDP